MLLSQQSPEDMLCDPVHTPTTLGCGAWRILMKGLIWKVSTEKAEPLSRDKPFYLKILLALALV